MQVQSFVIQIMYMVAFSVESVSGCSTHRYNPFQVTLQGVEELLMFYLSIWYRSWKITLTRFGG